MVSWTTAWVKIWKISADSRFGCVLGVSAEIFQIFTQAAVQDTYTLAEFSEFETKEH